ncbi:sulfite exporter TauE/SafE family protein 3-like isoform X4 [Camellia sinensis]|uniref:sulfite exporter TauE/SafE family protein 3-like isoform X4 n=1 Tax=Camellia sinensis TaxID=4442 RepID=UPI001035AA34|nr:sulfite exporter TauE/SafE family protein 3-like isoform X4 [Camellia sinensis]
MAEIGLQGKLLSAVVAIVLLLLLLHSFVFVSTESSMKQDFPSKENGTIQEIDPNYFKQILKFLLQKGQVGYEHVWPEMKFGWKIIVGTVVGFFGAAFGSVGGVGGGGIFVPMLTLIIGFDAKSSAAMSKCMIAGAAAASVFFNLKLRHPTLDLPIIDYDLALLFQPMLVLGISIGVAFNVIFADWMVTVLLIILFLGTSIKTFFKGLETWKKETIIKKDAARLSASNDGGSEEAEYKPLPGGPSNGTQMESNESKAPENYTTSCSAAYWIPVAVGASGYQAINLYKGRRVIASKGEEVTTWRVHQLVLYCSCGVLAGIVGGLLGLGGGFILSPLFLELGIPPQVSSATATFAMLFSSSMSVVEYYLLKRFPVPYALYFVAVATIAAFVGQHVVKRIITILGRASLIIFILACTIFISAISLGGVGIAEIIDEIEEKDYMGFEDICSY